jgi:hypothetical protein
MMHDVDNAEEYIPSEEDILQDKRGKWLQHAQQLYTSSTDYIDSVVRGQWERNLYNFNGKHLQRDKRKPIFRPKIRASVRAYEAALASALFTNNDLISVQGVNPNNKIQEVSAELNQALMQHRLEKTIPWFQTVLGAFQDTQKHGICVSKTYWKSEIKDETGFMPVLDEEGQYMLDEEGGVLGEEVLVNQEIVADEPVIDLLPPENFRFDPNADWRDPVKSSPYLIEMIPMFVGDVLARMEVIDPKTGHPEWHQYDKATLLTAIDETKNQSVRTARNANNRDPQGIGTSNDFDVVWVHFNIIRENNEDIAYYTLGTQLLLSDPLPLKDYFKHGRSAYQIGTSNIESHKTYPAAACELGENLQDEINTLANQRIENVKLVLNKRYFIRRQGNVDLGALMRNVPGGGVMVENPSDDVRVIETPDVTGSSYAEQDRLNMDMDEIMGTFSPSTVQSNRQLNETVGGMNLMSNGANAIQELTLRVFIETWVEPVLRTLVKLEQMYETDDVILALAQEKAGIQEQIRQELRDPELLDRLIQQDLTVTVNVGMGNTSPEQKLQRLMLAVNTTANMPEAAAKTDWEEVTKEVYAYAGFGDGGRFLLTEEKIAERQQGQPQIPPEIQAKQMEMQHKMQVEQMKEQGETQRFYADLDVKRELGFAALASKENLTMNELMARLDIADKNNRSKENAEALRAATSNREMNLKVNMGSGI